MRSAERGVRSAEYGLAIGYWALAIRAQRGERSADLAGHVGRVGRVARVTGGEWQVASGG